MRCAEARDKLAAYVDGSMSEPEAMRLLDHTAECAACRARLEDLEVRRSVGRRSSRRMSRIRS